MADKATKAYSYADIEKRKFKSILIEDDDFKKHLGEPQLGNSHWLVYGNSGDGKTSYALQIVKELCKNHKVHYNTVEEGMKKSFKLALNRENMKGVTGFNYHQEKMPDLKKRLERTRQAKIVVIDSVQYFFRGMKSKHYFDFICQFQDTTFIWISAAEGKNPKGKIAEDIYYDADIVINVRDFQAIVKKNRFEAYESRIIYEKGYNDRQLILVQ
jgi:predicted ATP-dependent serine protease